MDFSVLFEPANLQLYAEGLFTTLWLLLAAVSAGLLLSIPAAVWRVSRQRWLAWPVAAYTYVVRGTPLLMVIFWAYFLLPSLMGHKTDQFNTMLAALVIFDGAYLAEIIRSGIQSLPRGQMESARSLGFSYLQAMGLVILPQALRICLPAITNHIIAAMKNTSFVIIIGSITALFMGFLGIIQNDIKRVVAYSTLSQLCYMTVALGASAYSVAIFHLMTHAFF